MLLDLILLIIREVSKQSNKQARVPPQRKVRGAEVVLHCPACDTLGVATSDSLETMVGGQWVAQSELYGCAACGRSHNAALFRNDGGVLVINSRPCPGCGAQIPVTSSGCPRCDS